MEGGHHLADEDPEGVAGHAEVGDHQDDDQEGPHASLDQEVAGQGPVAPVGLEEAAVDAQQDPDAGGHQDQHHPVAVGERQLPGDPPLQQQDDDHLDGDAGQDQPVDLGHPPLDQMRPPGVLQGGDPADHPDQHGRAGHGQDEEQPEQLGDGPIGLGGDQPGHRHHHQRGGAVDHHAGDGHRARRGQPGADRVTPVTGAGGALLVGQRDHRAAGHGDSHRRGHGHRLVDRLDDLVDLLEDHVQAGLGCVGGRSGRVGPGPSPDSVMRRSPCRPLGHPQALGPAAKGSAAAWGSVPTTTR